MEHIVPFFPINVYWLSTMYEALYWGLGNLVGHKVDVNPPITETRISLKFFQKRYTNPAVTPGCHDFTREVWILDCCTNGWTNILYSGLCTQWQSSHHTHLHIAKNSKENKLNLHMHSSTTDFFVNIMVKHLIHLT